MHFGRFRRHDSLDNFLAVPTFRPLEHLRQRIQQHIQNAAGVCRLSAVTCLLLKARMKKQEGDMVVPGRLAFKPESTHLEHLLNPSQRLPRALFVFDQ